MDTTTHIGIATALGLRGRLNRGLGGFICITRDSLADAALNAAPSDACYLLLQFSKLADEFVITVSQNFVMIEAKALTGDNADRRSLAIALSAFFGATANQIDIAHDGAFSAKFVIPVHR